MTKWAKTSAAMNRLTGLLVVAGGLAMAGCAAQAGNETPVATVEVITEVATPELVSPTSNEPAKLQPGTIYLRSNPGPGHSETIYAMDTNGGTLTEIITLPEAYRFAALSADGSRIAFVDYSEDIEASKKNLPGSLLIGVMAIDGTLAHRVTSGESATDTNPEWSPDGTRIAFISNRNIGLDIFLVSEGGGDVTPITRDFPDSGASIDKRCIAWSPDGRQIAYTGTDLSRAGSQPAHIFVVNVDGSGQIDLTPDRDFERGACPQWSPDGKRIALASGATLHVMNADGSLLTEVFSGEAEIKSLIWSPDGEQIVWNDGRIRGIKLDGSGLRLLASEMRDYILLRVIPDQPR